MRATEMFLSFTNAQRHALDTQRNLAVRAGAGSGKTRVLVERIVQLLARSWDASAPLTLSAIVAVTFTRKAAAELQERLRDSFRLLLAAAPSLEEKAYWAGLNEELPRGMIGTIDSLCGRILREYGLLAAPEHRLEPGFDMLEGFEEEELKQEAIDRVINRFASNQTPRGEEAAQVEAARWWAISHGYESLSGHLHALLGSAVDPAVIVATQRSLPPVAERVQRLLDALPGLQYLREHGAAVRRQCQNLFEAIQRERKATVTLKKLGEALAAVVEALDESAGVNQRAALNALRQAFLTAEGESRSLSRGLGTLAEEIRALQDDWLPRLQCPDVDPVGETAAAKAADRLAVLLQPVQAEYLDLCREANRFDFLTIARRARDLLRHTPQARQELRKRWRYVLVDEFQDTNALQWEIISWLVGDGPDGPLDRDRLFIVGDPQQSIYRFRGAEVTVFQRVQDLIEASNRRHGHGERGTDYDAWLKGQKAGIDSSEAQRLGRMPLKENFRSLPHNLLNVVDAVMAKVFDPVRNDLDLARNRFETPHQELLPGLKNSAAGAIRYLLPAQENEENDQAGPSELQARAVADELIAAHGKRRLTAKSDESPVLRWADMAVLLPSRTEALTALENELRLRNIPYAVHKGIGFWQRQEVRDVVSLASCLTDAGDELSLFASLRSPLGQLLDTEILFLSQLGHGSLHRGLRRVWLGDTGRGGAAKGEGEAKWESEAPAEPDGAPVEQHPFQQPARQEPRPPEQDHLERILEEVWLGFTNERRERMQRAAMDFERWRRRVDRMAHADLLQSCLEDSGAYAIYAAAPDGDLAIGNLARLWNEIRGQEATRALGLARLARRLRSLVENATREEQAPLADERDAVQIMTVHAAKGLEFPLVAVMRLEHQAYRRNEARLLVRQEKDPLLAANADRLPDAPPGTISVMIRHPDRPRQWFQPALMQALIELDKAQQLAEKRRLFYVALTRAQERLILVAKEPKRTKDGERGRPREGWQRWLEDALGISEEHIRHGCWEDLHLGQRVDIIARVSSGSAVAALAAEIRAPALDLDYIRELPAAPLLPITGSAGLEAMRQAWREDRRVWWLRYRHQLLPGVRSPLRPPSPEEEAESLGTVVGTIVHRLFQAGGKVFEFASPSHQPLIQAMANSLLAARSDGAEGQPDRLRQEDVERVGEIVRATCRRLISESERAEPIRKLLSAPGAAEVPFVLELAGWHISGRFDKLRQAGEQFEIVDWKTDSMDSLSALVEHYTPQMRLYALALWRSGRLAEGQERIVVRLASLHHLQVATLPFALRDLSAFEAELRAELQAMADVLRSPLPTVPSVPDR